MTMRYRHDQHFDNHDLGVRGLFREHLTPEIIATVWKLALEDAEGFYSLVNLGAFWADVRKLGLKPLEAVLAVEWLHRHKALITYQGNRGIEAIRVLPLQSLCLEEGRNV
jgi:hypothetical protein